MNEPIYYSKCKKKTDNINPVTTQTSNGRWRVSAQCLKCKTNKVNLYKNLKKINYCWLKIPIKKKDGTTVSKAFEKLIKTAKSQNHMPPNLPHTDKGLEFGK